MTVETLDDRDAAAWVRRWEVQQAGHVPAREETFALMLEVLDRVTGGPRRVLDLGCGPGSLAGRAAERFPDAEVVGVDADPVMLELAQRTRGDRVTFVHTDLGTDGWAAAVTGAGTFDAAVSATALHWLPADGVAAFARTLAGVLRPGGVFLDFDTLLADTDATPRLARATTELRRERTEARTGAPGFEDFAAWWESAAGEPGLATAFAERDAAGSHPRGHAGSSLRTWVTALHDAGFAEVDTVTQQLDRRLLAAVR
jgi:SAM-dependent methyltransferase